MNISSVSAISAAFGGIYSGLPGSAAGTTSVTKIADGSTITTLRGSTGAIVSVTTAAPASRSPVPQASESTVDITA